LVFEGHVAYLAKETNKAKGTAVMRSGWRSAAFLRVVRRQYSAVNARIDRLTHINTDELSYCRYYEYVTVIIDHKRGQFTLGGQRQKCERPAGVPQSPGPVRYALVEAATIGYVGRVDRSRHRGFTVGVAELRSLS
jgi:hypothetical protein